MKRLIIEACVGFFNNINLCYKEHDKQMKFMRSRFIKRLQSKIERNIRVHQMNLMNTIEMLYKSEIYSTEIDKIDKVSYISKIHNIKNEIKRLNTIKTINAIKNISGIKDINKIKNIIEPKNIEAKPAKKKLGAKSRAVWRYKRSAEWWNTVRDSKDDSLLIEHLRVDRETYELLCQILNEKLKPSLNIVRESLSTEAKVAVGLYKLASNENLRSVGVKFGYHPTTVRSCFYQFCDACYEIMLKDEISLPNDEEIFEVMHEFEDQNGLPQVMGAFEGTPLSISPYARGYRRQVDKKGSPDLVLQAVVDANSLFRDISIPLDNTDFVEYNLNMKQLMSSMPKREIGGTLVPVYLVSNRQDEVQSWIMKPYSEVNTPEEESFNDCLSEASLVAEHAFIRLKGRFKILREPIAVEVSALTRVIGTCCILHNLLEKRGIFYNERWSSELTTKELIYTGPSGLYSGTNQEGERLRDHLKTYMSALTPQ